MPHHPAHSIPDRPHTTFCFFPTAAYRILSFFPNPTALLTAPVSHYPGYMPYTGHHKVSRHHLPRHSAYKRAADTRLSSHERFHNDPATDPFLFPSIPLPNRPASPDPHKCGHRSAKKYCRISPPPRHSEKHPPSSYILCTAPCSGKSKSDCLQTCQNLSLPRIYPNNFLQRLPATICAAHPAPHLSARPHTPLSEEKHS